VYAAPSQRLSNGFFAILESASKCLVESFRRIAERCCDLELSRSILIYLRQRSAEHYFGRSEELSKHCRLLPL
jgi:3-methyladenine DNA glycosylase AlkC